MNIYNKILITFITAILLLSDVYSAENLLTNDVNLTRGDAAYMDGFFELANSYYKKSFEQHFREKESTFSFNIGIKFLKTLIQTGKTKEASLILKQLSTKNNNANTDNQIEYYKGKIQQAKGSYKKALKFYRKILSKPLNIKLKILIVDSSIFCNMKLKRTEESYNLLNNLRGNLKVKSKIYAEVLARMVKIRILEGKTSSALTVLRDFNLDQLQYKKEQIALLFFWVYLNKNNLIKVNLLYKEALKKSYFRSDTDESIISILLLYVEKLYKAKEIRNALKVLDFTESICVTVEDKIYISLRKSEILSQWGMLQRAVLELETFRQKNQGLDNFKVDFQLAKLYQEIAAKNKNSKESLKLALEKYNDIIKKTKNKKNLFNAYKNKGACLQSLQRKSESVKSYLKAFSVSQGNFEKASALYFAGEVEYFYGLKHKDFSSFKAAAIHFNNVTNIKSSLAFKGLFMYGLCLKESNQYMKAAETFHIYCQNKKAPNLLEATLLEGICWLESNNEEKGIPLLVKFAKKHPKDSRAVVALLKSLISVVIDLKDTLKNTNGERYSKIILETFKNLQNKVYLTPALKAAAPKILHLKALLSWQHLDNNQAVKYWMEFLNNPEYASLPLAGDVMLWLAFNFSKKTPPNNEGALQLYNRLISQKNLMPLFSPIALYESAKIFYKMQNLGEANMKLTQVEKKYAKLLLENYKKDELAKSYLLHGDILTVKGQYNNAAETFYTKAAEIADSKNLIAAAKGRMADCYFTLATLQERVPTPMVKKKKTEFLKKAINIYHSIAYGKKTSINFQEQSVYKLAKSFEKNNEMEKAIDLYQTIFYKFLKDKKSGLNRDSYFFCRSGYSLGRLYLKLSRLKSAITIYKRLYESNIPGTIDAGILYKRIKRVEEKSD